MIDHPDLTPAELERRIAKGNLAYALVSWPDMPREKRDELVRKYIELSEPTVERNENGQQR